MQSITIVSNRLPFSCRRDPTTGDWIVHRSSGGLVAALEPVLRHHGGRWVGWPGAAIDPREADRVFDDVTREAGYEVEPVLIGSDLAERYYGGFANSVLWPLFHGMASRCDFRAEFWDAYVAVNARFARHIAESAGPDTALWVHDYHLIPLGEAVRRLVDPRWQPRIGFFLHIPFPTLHELVKVPWREQLLRGLLAYDVIGFQTERDRRNFLACVSRLLSAQIDRSRVHTRIAIGGREVWAGVFPIGIDFDGFARTAASADVDKLLGSLRHGVDGCRVLLGVDRLDYTKGLVERMRAFGAALDRHPALRGKVVFHQLVVPSRDELPEYAALKQELDRTVGDLLGRHATATWQPVRYRYAGVSATELAALYRLADVAVVTPLCDGMNLVAKEYCAVQEDGVLVLSEMAGAAAQLRESALLVNPYDIDAMAATLVRALEMPRAQRIARMRKARDEVKRHDVFAWARSFVSALRAPSAAAEKAWDEYLPLFQIRRGTADATARQRNEDET